MWLSILQNQMMDPIWYVEQQVKREVDTLEWPEESNLLLWQQKSGAYLEGHSLKSDKVLKAGGRLYLKIILVIYLSYNRYHHSVGKL